MEGKIIYKGKTEKGKEIEIRYPAKTDLKAMWEYINTLSQERTFISYQGEEVSLEDEEKFLNSLLEKIANRKAVQLLVVYEEKIIGISDIVMKERIEEHIGVFGITIAKSFRGEGIGSKLMGMVISEAKRKLLQLEIIILGVFVDNQLAKQMYKNSGFIEYGILPNGVKLENGYTDHVYMYKVIKG